jgi:hypothetical protein
METLVTIVSLLLIIAVIASPIVILIGLKRLHVKNYKFLAYLAVGAIVTSVLTFIFGWWSGASNQILLCHYGYDLDAMDYTGRFSNVSAENLERVKQLEMRLMGVGWPLKSIMMFVFYAPYILMVYLVVYLIAKSMRAKDAQMT